MANSKMLASLIGPTFLALGGMVLLNQSMLVNLTHDMAEGPMILAVSGILVFVAGIAILRVHNVWVKGWPVVVTIVGWAALLSGLGRMFFPALILEIAARFVDCPYTLPTAGTAMLVLGGFLSFKASSR